VRIFVISGYGYWGDFLPTDLNSETRQVGGGETAMISVSKELAKKGHEVIVFYDTVPGKYDGVDYLPTGLFAPMACNMEHDALVSWDAPHALRLATKSAIRVMAYQLNDTFIGPFCHVIDLYLHPSKWHASRYKEMYPELPMEKCVAPATNAVDFNRYVNSAEEVDPYRVIYSSSPDRGLHHLLEMWPEIVKKEKKANLHVYYDMKTWMDNVLELAEGGYETVTTDRARILKAQIDKGLPNVTFHGGVGQGQLARAQLAARVLAYPCDPVQPTEGFSMTVLEGVASGCNVITTDADAFPELWANTPGVTMLPLPVDKTSWIENILKYLGTEKEGPRVNTNMTWTHVANIWERELSSCLKAKHH